MKFAFSAVLGLTLAGIAIRVGMGAASGAGSQLAPGTRAAPVVSATAAALYTQIISKYLAADWETLEVDLAKTKEISGMSKEQQADITYLRQAYSEGRPGWWKAAKMGQKFTFRAMVWQRNFAVSFDPGMAGGMQYSSTNGAVTITIGWPAGEMDSQDKAEHGFSKGDLANMGVWQSLEAAEIYLGLDIAKINALSGDERTKLDRYLLFRGNITSGFYGTPRTRRWTGFLSFDAYGDRYAAANNFIPRKPLGAMLVQEIVSHPAKYPTLKLPAAVDAGAAEKMLATSFMTQFERKVLTFAEDKALREAIKEFALANTLAVFNTGRILLPNKQFMMLDPTTDADFMAKRNIWLMEEIGHPGIHAEAASRPSLTRPGTTTRAAGVP